MLNNLLQRCMSDAPVKIFLLGLLSLFPAS